MGFFDLDEPYYEPEKPKPKTKRGIVFDLAKGEQLAKEGMQQVQDNNPDFTLQYRWVIDALPRGWIGTSEEIQKIWKPMWPQPHHPNCWGSNWGSAVKRGDLVMLPFRQPMKSPRSHARKTELYKKV